MTLSYKGQITAKLDAADIDGAIAVALERVKTAPTDSDARRLYIDLLIVKGDFERADKQADIMANTAGELTLGMSLLRGRLRAAKAREMWFTQGAVPAFPDQPSERDELAMKLFVARSAGDTAEVVSTLSALTSASETAGIIVNGKEAPGFRDADDRIPHALEVLCSDGSYMWVDFARIEKVDFAPVSAIRDLAWRPAKLALMDGAETDVVICNTYFSPQQDNTDRLARTTDWQENAGGVVSGRGQKAFLAGDDAIYVLDVKSIGKTE